MASFQEIIDDLARRTAQKVGALMAEARALDEESQRMFKAAEKCAVESDRSAERLTQCPDIGFMCERDEAPQLQNEIAHLEAQLERRRAAARSRQFSRLARDN